MYLNKFQVFVDFHEFIVLDWQGAVFATYNSRYYAATRGNGTSYLNYNNRQEKKVVKIKKREFWKLP